MLMFNQVLTNYLMQQKKERAGVVIATTALLWCTEAMPLMITALMPAILFPFAGVLDTKQVSAVYWNVSVTGVHPK
jgi:sodium-dependent dicarboxylate transporter 2/3/5